MAVPEVREHVLQWVTEACRQAEWDGVELDWQRHAFHLPAADAYRLRYTVTDLMRAIRAATDAIAGERGRPFHVAVRVATPSSPAAASATTWRPGCGTGSATS
jgi:hypothetical protein